MLLLISLILHGLNSCVDMSQLMILSNINKCIINLLPLVNTVHPGDDNYLLNSGISPAQSWFIVTLSCCMRLYQAMFLVAWAPFVYLFLLASIYFTLLDTVTCLVIYGACKVVWTRSILDRTDKKNSCCYILWTLSTELVSRSWTKFQKSTLKIYLKRNGVT